VGTILLDEITTMVRKVQVTTLHEVDKSWLGKFPVTADFDEIIDEDADIYLPDGTLALVFRKKKFQTLSAMTPDTDNYQYWKWTSRALLSDQRGDAAGKTINTNPEIRLTEGQKKFFSAAIKRELTLDEARELLKDTTISRSTFYMKKTEEDGLVDVEEIEKWATICRKKNTPPAEREEALEQRNKAKLAWFENWLVKIWEVSKDKVEAAKEAKKRYVTIQPRSNRVYSNVVGAIDRSGRTPYGRLTKTSTDRWEEFVGQKEFYSEADELLRETMPETHKILSERFNQISDKRYTLFGTCFTSITVNYNFQVAYHYDGANAKNAVAVLSTLEQGSFEGSEFVFPQLRLAFNLRHGDFLAGDNQGLMHGMMPFKNTSEDFESIWFVMYQRDSILKLDTLECEACRKAFMSYAMENFADELGSGEKNWGGSFVGMWGSPQWNAYKELRSKEGEYDYTKCHNTGIKGDPDLLPVGRGAKGVEKYG